MQEEDRHVGRQLNVPERVDIVANSNIRLRVFNWLRMQARNPRYEREFRRTRTAGGYFNAHMRRM